MKKKSKNRQRKRHGSGVTQKVAALKSRHSSSETHSSCAQKKGRSMSEAQPSTAPIAVQVSSEAHHRIDNGNGNGHRRVETHIPHAGRSRTDAICDDLWTACNRRRQFMRAHLRLEQQKMALFMQLYHDGHRHQPNLRTAGEPWRCVLCEKYRETAEFKTLYKNATGSADDIDQRAGEIQMNSVGNNGHVNSEARLTAANGNGQRKSATHASVAQVDPLYLPFNYAIANILVPRETFEGQIAANAILLPVWKSWAESVKGIGPSLLGQLIGETGNLLSYDNPGKIWKRMGQAPGQEKIRAVATRTESAEDRRQRAIDAGCCPRRKALMFNINTSLMRAAGAYYQIYLRRKEGEAANNERGEYRDQALTAAARMGKGKENVPYHKYYSRGKLSPKHIDMRARRYMGKAFLKDLWIAWWKAEGKELPEMPRFERRHDSNESQYMAASV